MNEIFENLVRNINDFQYDDKQNEKIANDFTESLFSDYVQKKNKLNKQSSKSNIKNVNDAIHKLNFDNINSQSSNNSQSLNNSPLNNNNNKNNISKNNSNNNISKNNSNNNISKNNISKNNSNNNISKNNSKNNISKNNNNNNIQIDLKPFQKNLEKILKIQINFKKYLKTKKVFIIQRSFRNHLIKKYNLPQNFYFNDKFLKLQTEIYEENYKNNLSILFPALFMDKTDINSFTKNLIFITNNPNRNPYDSQKIILFSKILDFDMMINTDETYDELWSLTYENLYSKCLKNFDPIQNISLGSQHTICLTSKGKIYSFGWNNYGQCGIKTKSTIIKKQELNNNESLVEITKYNELKPKIINKTTFKSIDFYNKENNIINIEGKSIICGEDHTIILDIKGNVFTFGINLNGQLGLGHNHCESTPKKIKSLNNIKQINSAGYINFAVNKEGDAFIWPYSDKNGNLKLIPAKINLKEKINNISCGNNFCLILSNSGLVYSMGKSNKYGQLGTGDFSPHLSPILIEYFLSSNERITQISCGFKHSVAKTSLGKVYTWGSGSKGQLGNNSYNNLTIPGIVKFEDNFMKVFQISAGFRCTFFLGENRKVYACGCNGTISMEKTPILFDIIDKVPEMAIESNYSVVRIMNCWNKSFSLFYCTIADSSNMKINPVKLNGILNKLAAKWENNENKPPFVESIEKYFDIGCMRKEKFKN